MSDWTPGPWTIYPETDGTEICAVTMAPKLPIRQVIAHPVRGENWIANARLIAAAPDLLAYAECEEARACCEDIAETVLKRHGYKPGESSHEFMDKMRRAALAKARGES